MGSSIFERKDILVHKKHSEITFEQFVENIPKDYKGYLLETINTDTVGRSNAKPRWGKIFEYQNGEIFWRRNGNIQGTRL